MASQQTSLFDFFEDPVPVVVPKKAKAAIVIPTPIVAPEVIVVNEVPVEVDFAPTPIAVNKEILLPEYETDIFKKAVAQPKSTRGRKKLSEVVIASEMLDIPTDDILFQKKYYSIGIVAQMFKVNISHIRFWEKEFDILKPKLNGKGDRHFRPEDIKNLKLIHHLVKEKKYTIEGARDFLKKNKKGEEIFAVIEELNRTKLFLNDLKMSL
jgi:DNA-binding transcriptional MerR regulator